MVRGGNMRDTFDAITLHKEMADNSATSKGTHCIFEGIMI